MMARTEIVYLIDEHVSNSPNVGKNSIVMKNQTVPFACNPIVFISWTPERTNQSFWTSHINERYNWTEARERAKKHQQLLGDEKS